MSQLPHDFAENEKVRAFLKRSGAETLPLILVDGEIALLEPVGKDHLLQIIT